MKDFNINAKTRKALNNLLASINNSNPMTYERYLELYNELQTNVEALGFTILGVTHVDKSVEQTERRRHKLLVNGTEDETVANCVFVVSIYNFESGKVEFTGYFS